MTPGERLDTAIEAAADALLSVCAVQTGDVPDLAVQRALAAIGTVMARTEAEAAAAWLAEHRP